VNLFSRIWTGYAERRKEEGGKKEGGRKEEEGGRLGDSTYHI
jgi:hypothetical protein